MFSVFWVSYIHVPIPGATSESSRSTLAQTWPLGGVCFRLFGPPISISPSQEPLLSHLKRLWPTHGLWAVSVFGFLGLLYQFLIPGATSEPSRSTLAHKWPLAVSVFGCLGLLYPFPIPGATSGPSQRTLAHKWPVAVSVFRFLGLLYPFPHPRSHFWTISKNFGPKRPMVVPVLFVYSARPRKRSRQCRTACMPPLRKRARTSTRNSLCDEAWCC